MSLCVAVVRFCSLFCVRVRQERATLYRVLKSKVDRKRVKQCLEIKRLHELMEKVSMMDEEKRGQRQVQEAYMSAQATRNCLR